MKRRHSATNKKKQSSFYPQHDGPQIAIGCRNIFIHDFGLGRAYPTVQERSENQNVVSSQKGFKKTSLVSNIAISTNMMKNLASN